MKPCIETSCFVSILFLLMEFNYPYWLVANSQAGQAWNAANQPNMGSDYPYPSYHSQWQPESHPATHLGSSWHSLPPGQLRQNSFHPSGQPIHAYGRQLVPTFAAHVTAPIAGVAAVEHQHQPISYPRTSFVPAPIPGVAHQHQPMSYARTIARSPNVVSGLGKDAKTNFCVYLNAEEMLVGGKTLMGCLDR